jgi:cobalt/nickel transport system ATP-binding protein
MNLEAALKTESRAAAAVAARGLGYIYPDGRRALEDLSFSVAPGEAVGVIGPNGAGKTTLFMVLAGLFPPGSGELTILGSPAGERMSAQLRRRIGLVFQSTDEQLFSPTVFDDVAFGPLNFGFPRGEARERVARALEAVGLLGYEGRSPHHLSSGEKRRVAIASVLSYDPEVLILDEPTSDLDPRGRRELTRLLSSMSHSLLIASHDLEFIARTCSRVMLLAGGSLKADGPASLLLTDAALLESNGLEVPLGIRGLDAGGLERLLDPPPAGRPSAR